MNINWDYIAGFTDGEGYIGIVGRGPRITWGQKDKRQLQVIHGFLEQQGLHPILSQRKPVLGQSQGVYVINLGRRDDVIAVIKELYPRLMLKAKNCEKVIKWIEDNPPRTNRSEVNIEEFSTLYHKNYTQTEIARILKRGASKIYKFSKEHGFKFKIGGEIKNGKHIRPMSRDQYLNHRREKEKKSKCKDCEKPIYPEGERCKSCALRHRHQTNPG